MNLTYARYLKVDELISLQDCLSDGPEHDEMLFITIHQVYELWFKQLLHEGDRLVELFNADQQHQAHHGLKRMLKILKTLVQQVDVLETMTPLEFLSFRKFLDNSSGFQSYQFRELEFFLGKKSQDLLKHFQEDDEHLKKLESRLNALSLWQVFLAFLNRRGYSISESTFLQPLNFATKEDPSLHPVLLEVYRNAPDLAELCESLVDLDEGVQEWRYRHVKMVQRTIGNMPGTGGSSGAGYLTSTLFQPLFPDLWAIRSEF